MLVPARAPFDPASAVLRALYVSLNSPVVTLDALPTGPASATVALHPGDPPGATFSVRSVRTGQVAYFVSDLEHGDGPELALEAALAHAEGMGFLFDEDELAAGGAEAARAAVVLWRELLGEAAAADLPPLPPAPAPLAATGPSREAPPQGPSAAAPERRGPGPGVDLSQVLSKFRRGAPPEQALEAVALHAAALEGHGT